MMNRAEAEEVVQDVFREILELGMVEVTQGYLFKSVKNRSLNRLRGRGRFRNCVERLKNYIEVHLQVLCTEEEISLEQSLAMIPEHYRVVLILRLNAELKIREISELLRIPEGTVKSRINKGVSLLKEIHYGK